MKRAREEEREREKNIWADEKSKETASETSCNDSITTLMDEIFNRQIIFASFTISINVQCDKINAIFISLVPSRLSLSSSLRSLAVAWMRWHRLRVCFSSAQLKIVSFFFPSYSRTDCEDVKRAWNDIKKASQYSENSRKKKTTICSFHRMIYEGLLKLSTDSTLMIDDILNSECVCTFSFRNCGIKFNERRKKEHG